MRSRQLLDHYRHLTKQPLTIIDLETTGFKPPLARAIEISLIQATFKDGILHQQTDLINPGVPIPDQITRITGITQSMIDRAESSATIWPQYFPLLTQNLFTAHNVDFDYPFALSECAQMGLTLDRPDRLCTVMLSRLLLPDLPSRSLPNLVQHFNFNVSTSHRAEADTQACWLLTHHLFKLLTQEDDTKLLDTISRQWLPLREAAKLLNCHPGAVEKKLADLPSRLSSRSKIRMYQRGAIEQFMETQLELL
jgi:DNA polymerase III subunit epsilon